MFALGPGSTLQHADGLVEALRVICHAYADEQPSCERSNTAQQNDNQVLQLGIRCMQKEPQMALKPREAAFSPTER